MPEVIRSVSLLHDQLKLNAAPDTTATSKVVPSTLSAASVLHIVPLQEALLHGGYVKMGCGMTSMCVYC